MKKNKKQNKGNDNKVIYGILINKVEKNGKYVIPNMVKKSSSSKLSAYAPYAHKLIRKELIIISKKNNLKLFKTLSKIFNDKISYILVAKDIMDEAIDIVVNKKIKTFKLHTRLSLKEHYELIKKRREIATPAFFFMDSFTGPGLCSVRGTMRSSQYENIFNAARKFGNMYAEVNGDCSELLNPKVGKEDSSTASKKDARPIHTPIKIDKDKCTFKFNVGGFTEKDCSLGELADKLGENEAKQGDNISATIKLAPDRLEANLINNLLQILDDKCLGISSSTTLADKVAMILHEVEHYKFQKDFDGDRVSILSINPRNPKISNGNEIIVGGKYILNGSNDIGMNYEIRPYIGKKVVVTKLHKNGLFTILCSGPDGKVFNSIAKYNLTPLLKEDNDDGGNFNVTFKKTTNLSKLMNKWIAGGVGEKNKTEIKVECNTAFPIDATNLVDDDKRVNCTPECSIPLADKEIASKKTEEVSEYLDNTEYDIVVNKITNDISMHYRHIKIAGRHMFSIPSDFRERLCDLSYLPDLDSRFKQFDNIGILQQELLLKSKDEDMLESIEELTFAQVLELFTVLADMKGMIKIKDEESGEYCLKHLEKKAELIANDIKVADITDIKISKMGVLLLTASDTIGEFGEDSKKCNWSLFKNLEEAINVLRTIHNEQKIYTLLKYQSRANTIFSNIVPRISKASFGNAFAVLLDADTLFYYVNKVNSNNIEEIKLSCKPTKLKKEHNVKMGNRWAHFAIEITEGEVETKINIEPYISSQAPEYQKVEQIL